MRPHGAGAIVCTASVASLRGGLGPHAYTAAKAGVRGLVESVAVEVAPYGLRVNAVAPGGTVTSLAAGLMSGDPDDLETPHRRLAAASSSGVPTTADDVAAAACFLASTAAGRVNGACLVIDGGDDVLSTKGRSYYHQEE
jgi:NAD(P)-dependent dehydrogenase (short-subunit alcohol dehydrogenase family)